MGNPNISEGGIILKNYADFQLDNNCAEIILPNDNLVPSHNLEEKFSEGNAWGLSANIDIHECNPKVIRDRDAIIDYVDQLLTLIDMTPVGKPIVEHFGPQEKIPGYSMMQLIETSNVTAHYDDDTDTGFLDIFSCKYYDPFEATQFTQEFFKSKYAKVFPRIRRTR